MTTKKTRPFSLIVRDFETKDGTQGELAADRGVQQGQ